VRAGIKSDDNENTASPVVSDFRGHQAIFEDFIRAIQEDKRPICDGLDGARSIALIEGIYRAAKSVNRNRLQNGGQLRAAFTDQSTQDHETVK